MTTDTHHAAERSRVPVMPAALTWAQHLDPRRLEHSPATPASLRGTGALTAAAQAAGTERLPRTSNTAQMRLRRDTALVNAQAASHGARAARRRGNDQAAAAWQAEADELRRAAEALTTWLDWLERDAVANAREVGLWHDLPALAHWLEVEPAMDRPPWHPAPGATAATRGPVAPRAPATGREYAAA